MNDDTPPFTEANLTPDSIQNKADILENNIFKDLKRSENDTLAQLQVDRSISINPVIEKAIYQVLFRFNIHPSILENEFKEALNQSLNKESKPITLNRHIQGTYLNQGDRQLEIIVGPRMITILIKGIQTRQEQHEEIAKFYFEHESHPGKLLPNGKIDFRELHKFPSVKMGDKLLFVKYPVPGKPGISFEGKVIPVSEPRALELTYKEGVIKNDHLDENGNPVGYFLTAAKTGVIILTRIDGIIRDIDVNDKIELETIDFSIGNIGTEFISPVSMKIGTINNGFRIKAHGLIEVLSLDGGSVITDNDAMIDQVRPKSYVQAAQDISARTVMDSDLISSKGKISIKDELRDSRVKAPEVLFKSAKGIMLNTIVDTYRLDFQNVYFCGVNKIYLGRDLFKKRNELLEETEKVDKGHHDVQEAIDYIKAKLLSGLKALASQISDDNLLNMFKLLIHSLQSFTFSDSFKVLENLRAKMNVMQVDQLKKTFQELEKLSKAIIAYSNKKKELVRACEQIEAMINSIRFVLKGKINPTATVQIFCNKKSNDEPVFEIKPVKKDAIEIVSYSGSYTLDSGFKTN
ncbi:MAG: FapA family protein [Proteobacteria bacterium]|nr:FapA family protein [Pseudomonadota bacterium]